MLFADKLPHATQPEGITGGYLFSFNVECVDESGKILKTQKFTGNGTLWSFEPPEVDGYTTTCASITRDDITNWRYPASHYGEGDFSKSICMAVETGFDTDCNGATVGSILGMANGKETISEAWSAPINNKLHTSIFGVGTVNISDCVEKTLSHIENS